MPLQVPLPGLHNVYNAAAAVAAATALALPTAAEPEQARRAMADLRPAFGRLEEIQAGDRKVVLAFVKNPTAYNATLREVLRRPGPKHVLAAHSNTSVDGEDFAWLWDVDLEQLVAAARQPGRQRHQGRGSRAALQVRGDPARADADAVRPPRGPAIRALGDPGRRVPVHPRWLHADARAARRHAATRLGRPGMEGLI